MAMDQDALADYVTIPERIAEFREQYPEGRLTPADIAEPVKIITIGDKTFLQYIACAYRSYDDDKPGVAIAWEPFPGTTNFTRNSEAMNAETSAWGRAIVAVLAADQKRGIATKQEIENRRAEQNQPQPNLAMLDEAIQRIATADSRKALVDAWSGAAYYALLDVEVPGEGFTIRELWLNQKAVVDAIGESTEEPAPVAPVEDTPVDTNPRKDDEPPTLDRPVDSEGRIEEPEKPLTPAEQRAFNKAAAQAARDAKSLEPDLHHGDH